MTNEEKARELANNNCTHICLADCTAESYFGSENDCYRAGMQMAEWKDNKAVELYKAELLQFRALLRKCVGGKKVEGLIDIEASIAEFRKKLNE